jgi:hypothetical protein
MSKTCDRRWTPRAVPWQALDEPRTEVIERHRDAHLCVNRVPRVRAQQDHFVVLGEVVVGDCHASGAHGDVHQAVRAVGEVAVVHPDVVRGVNVHGIAIGSPPASTVRRGASDGGGAGGDDVVDVHAVEYHVGDGLKREPGTTSDVDVAASAVDGFEAVEDELLAEADGHVSGEHNPQRPLLNAAVAQSPRDRICRIHVAGIRHHINPTISASDGVPSRSDCAIRESLTVSPPFRIAPPTLVYQVSGCPRCAFTYHPPRALFYNSFHAASMQPSFTRHQSMRN